jgi:hypothetical protein
MGLGLVGVAKKSFTRLLIVLAVSAGIILATLFAYLHWTPGLEITDGRYDLGRNGIWIQHAWMGDDKWFIKNNKKDKIGHFRNPENIKQLALLLHDHHIMDVFPHLCPTGKNGRIPDVNHEQVNLFLQTFRGFRVIPWVGGVLGVQAFPEREAWRRNFTESIRNLLLAHPEFSGVHINIEPCPSGNKDFLLLLDDVRKMLPKGKVLSVAAFPPPTILHPFEEVHWDREYYHEVSKRADQIVVMMYDTSMFLEKVYQALMSRWTKEVLEWSEGAEVLLGLPAYEDKNVGYHNPRVENIKNSLMGLHAGLISYKTLPKNYQGIAIYCEWEMDDSKYELLRTDFLKAANRTVNEYNSITATSTHGGRRIPHGKSGGSPATVIGTISDDRSYGYMASNPIKVGGESEKKGPKNEVLYIHALYGPNGEPIEFERLGSCCPFKTTKGIFGRGLLDVYVVRYKGQENPIKLYINPYEYENPKVPYGFSMQSKKEE